MTTLVNKLFVSIHALLAESDFASSGRFKIVYSFYPRSPCGERHAPNRRPCQHSKVSIHALLAESDISCARSASKLGGFYPRSPCGERHFSGTAWVQEFPVSIHALLAESDTWARGSRVTYVVSIHALLAESDGLLCYMTHHCSCFYPRSPCGERHINRGPYHVKRHVSIHALLAESDGKSHKLTGPN